MRSSPDTLPRSRAPALRPGARPSPGAATFAHKIVSKTGCDARLGHIAAPGDGRTPQNHRRPKKHSKPEHSILKKPPASRPLTPDQPFSVRPSIPPVRKLWPLLLLALFLLAGHLPAAESTPSLSNNAATVILVAGAPGESGYGEQFAKWIDNWTTACRQANARTITIGCAPTNTVSDKDSLRQTLTDEPKATANDLWLVLIGHGTFDGHDAKFNLRGPDLAATELAAWIEQFRRPLVVINTASSSGPFINALSAPGRVIVTATSSGYEQNYARFGQYLATAINDPAADLDKDGQTSLLEAFLTASHQVDEFYRVEGRLATEHALLDDNGDKLGTPAQWFRGIRAVKKPRENAALDGLRAHQIHLVRSAAEQKLSPEQRLRRDELEQSIAALREKKSQMPEDQYYQDLEKLLLELAGIYR